MEHQPQTLTRVVAVPCDTAVSPEVLWCLAESVWRFAEDNELTVLSFDEVDPISPAEVPLSAGRMLGGHRDGFDWHRFEAVVVRA